MSVTAPRARACGVAALAALVACDATPADQVDAAVDADPQGDAGITRTVTVVMGIDNMSGRQIPPAFGLAGVTLALAHPVPGSAVVEVRDGAVRLAGAFQAGPAVVRTRGVAIGDPSLEVVLVLAVDTAVFTGVVDGDARLGVNWDDFAASLVGGPRVFVPEAPIATVAPGTDYRGDVLVDGATVRIQDLTLTRGSFIGRGTLEPPIGITRASVALVDGAATGNIPLLVARGPVRTHGDVVTERVIVETGGTLTVEAGDLDTGVGESFVLGGGTLVLGEARLVNGRHLDVAGTLRTTSTFGELRAVRLDVTGALDLQRGSLRLAAGDFSAAQSFVVGDSHETTIEGDGGAMTMRSAQAFGRLHLRGHIVVPGAPLEARGPATLGARIDGELYATGGLTIDDASQLPRLLTTDLVVLAPLVVTERLVSFGTVSVGVGHTLALGAASTNTVDGDLRVDGHLINQGTTTVRGTLHFGPGATLAGTGLLVAPVCRAGGILDAPPCP